MAVPCPFGVGWRQRRRFAVFGDCGFFAGRWSQTRPEASAQQQGITNVTPDLILAANGIPPDLSGEVGRYQAIETQFVEQVNGGKIPTSAAAQAATITKLELAQCVAAKTLNPVVNPQFGQLSYSQSQFVVVTAPNPVAAPPGPPKPAPAGLPAAC